MKACSACERVPNRDTSVRSVAIDGSSSFTHDKSLRSKASFSNGCIVSVLTYPGAMHPIASGWVTGSLPGVRALAAELVGNEPRDQSDGIHPEKDLASEL